MDMQLIAWMAATLVFASFFMKTIVPLRTVAIVSNLVFILYALLGLHYGIFDKVLPIFVLHAALLPLNWLRLREVRNSIRSVRDMKAGGPPHAYLLPYMTPRPTQRGEALFQQGDLADSEAKPVDEKEGAMPTRRPSCDHFGHGCPIATKPRPPFPKRA